ncbi:hypothetical protein RI129_004005 [Pyrocoelia pectoralis]|uniref:Uncharacterized protein n=1 Tax=Pyrocoelia pectoralis TaxID=417401 RepID=A0AAN7VRY9_9COLE
MIRSYTKCLPNLRSCGILRKERLVMSTITIFNITSKYSTNKNNENKRSASVYEVCKRLLSSDDGVQRRKLPPLMNFPEIIWPSLFKSMRNFILSTFIIKPYMDHEFSIPDFVKGSKKALEVYNMWYQTNCLREI